MTGNKLVGLSYLWHDSVMCDVGQRISIIWLVATTPSSKFLQSAVLMVTMRAGAGQASSQICPNILELSERNLEQKTAASDTRENITASPIPSPRLGNP